MKQLSRQRGTQARFHSRGCPARQELPHDYERNRRIPSVKMHPISRQHWNRPGTSRTREWPKRTTAFCPSGRSRGTGNGSQIRRSGQLSSMFGGAADRCRVFYKRRSLTGSVSVPAREPGKPSRVRQSHEWDAVERPNRLPTRRLGGGASVVVRGREGRPHGEERQDVSFWTTEGFDNREGSR